MSPDYRDGIDWGWQDQSRQANPGDAANDGSRSEEFLVSRPVAHPVARVLAGHVPTIGVPAPASRAVCGCGWRGVVRDWPAHLADVLVDRAGLLAPTDATADRI